MSPRTTTGRWVRLGHFAGLVMIAVMPTAATLGFPTDADTWWHLRVGDDIVRSGTVPEHDHYSRPVRGEPWLAYSWLYEVGLSRMVAGLGPAGVLWARTFLAALSAAALLGLLLHRAVWDLRTHLAGWLIAITLVPLGVERPWHVTIAFTAVTVFVVQESRIDGRVRRFAWLPLLFILWANVHIQFVYGGFVLALGVLFPGNADRRAVLGLAIACGLAVFINPYHMHLLDVIFDYATQTGPLREVRELAPADPADPWTWAGFALIGWGLVATLRKRPFDPFAFALLAIGFAMMLRMRRDLWLASVAAAASLRTLEPLSAKSVRIHTIIAIVLGTFLVIRGIDLATGANRRLTAANEIAYPVNAVEFVRREQFPGPVFQPFDWGGYLIHALPEHPVAIDGRTNLYGTLRVVQSMQTWRGESGWEFDPELQSARLIIAPADRPLTALLRQRSEWRIVYADEVAVVFVR